MQPSSKFASQQQQQRPAQQDDRPIKSSGQYNLNFIDWQNELENICDSGYNFDCDDPNQQCPIFGMDIETFNSLLRQENYEFEEEHKFDNGLSEEELKKVSKLKMRKSTKDCTICTLNFSKGHFQREVIRRLPCGHIFHDKCIVPWLKTNEKCPNCRFNIKEFLQKNQ